MTIEEILEQIGPIKGAVDPFLIARQLEVQISEGPNLPHISVESVMKGRVVWIDPGQPDAQRNYELATKLAVVMGEREDCEGFARDLLLPEKLFKRTVRDIVVREMGSMLEVKYLTPVLAEIFKVPEFAILHRLKTLGLISDDGTEVIYDTQFN